MDKYKVSSETIEALNNQIDVYSGRINNYKISINKLEKFKNKEVVKKSIEGYLKQCEILESKIQFLKKDLEKLENI